MQLDYDAKLALSQFHYLENWRILTGRNRDINLVIMMFINLFSYSSIFIIFIIIIKSNINNIF